MKDNSHELHATRRKLEDSTLGNHASEWHDGVGCAGHAEGELCQSRRTLPLVPADRTEEGLRISVVHKLVRNLQHLAVDEVQEEGHRRSTRL